VGTLKGLKLLCKIALGLDAAATLLTIFLLVFSSQSPTYVLCASQFHSEFPSACIDYESSVCIGTNIEEGQAFTWLIGVSLMLIASVSRTQGFWLRALLSGLLAPKIAAVV